MNRRTLIKQVLGSVSVVTVTGLSGCSSSGLFSSSDSFTITIDYNSQWQGSVGNEDGQRSVQGEGSEQFEVDGDIVSAVVQKQNSSRAELTVSISLDGDIVAQQSTTASFGTVSLSYTRGEGSQVEDNGDGNSIQEVDDEQSEPLMDAEPEEVAHEYMSEMVNGGDVDRINALVHEDSNQATVTEEEIQVLRQLGANENVGSLKAGEPQNSGQEDGTALVQIPLIIVYENSQEELVSQANIALKPENGAWRVWVVNVEKN